MTEKIAFIGLGRGVGLSVLRQLEKDSASREILVLQRKDVAGLESSEQKSLSLQWEACDLNREDSVQSAIATLKAWQPHRVWVFAGGGPFGDFGECAWSAHAWALQVSLSSLLHLGYETLALPSVQQFIATGSLVADTMDLRGSSYAAAKAGLRAWLQSVQGEELAKGQSGKDIRLFRPPYFARGLLPAGSPPFTLSLTRDVDALGQKFASWATNPLFRSTTLTLAD